MKILVFNIAGWLFLIVALIFFWSHFTSGAVDVIIGDSQETVYFKPVHSLEFALASTFLSVLFFVLTRVFWPKDDKENVEEELQKDLSPDEAWGKYLESTLKYPGTYEKEKIKSYFEELGKAFQSYKIHNFEETADYRIKIELRGQMNDFPVKIGFSVLNDLQLKLKADIFPAYFEIYKKSGLFSTQKAKDCDPEYLETYMGDYAKSYSFILKLNYDLEKIPVHKDISDPWSKDDQLRIFVANGIFIEEYEETAKIHLAVFQSFSKEFQKKLFESIYNNQLKHILLSIEEIEVAIKADRLLESPLTFAYNSLDLLVKIAEEFETVPVSGQLNLATLEAGQAEKVRLVTCNYCTSKFPLIDECRCPNCGASYS